MELSNKEKIVAYGAAMYLLGIEIEAGREEIEHMVQQGFSLSSIFAIY